MIKEDYVSFETAKLLKEKGFPQQRMEFAVTTRDCSLIVNGSQKVKERAGTRFPYYPYSKLFLYEEDWAVLPTLQMTMKWLREAHHIHTEICLYKTSENDVEPKKSRKAPYYTFGVWDSTTGDNVDKRLTNDFIGDTYEQACEEAIKYCLKNLI